MRKPIALPALAATFLLTMAMPIHAEPHAKAFTAAFVTQEVLGFSPEACPAAPFLQGTTSGAGIASHMGKVSLSSTDCVFPGQTSFTFTNGKLVLTAANGDTVTAEYSGSLLPTVAFPVHTLSGAYRVTGGTGRFTGATGSGYLRGISDIASGKGAYQAFGTIVY
jgi:hypothetical protein